MIYILLNGFAIVVAAVASLLFGIACHRVMYRTRPGTPVSPGTIVTVFLAELWLCAILAGALILAPPKGDVWTMTLGTAFIIWIGFVVPALVASYRYRMIPMRTAAVDCGHWLGAMLVQAVVLRLIGLVAPG